MPAALQATFIPNPSRVVVCLAVFAAELVWMTTSGMRPDSLPAGSFTESLLYHVPSLSRLLAAFLVFALLSASLAWRPLAAHALSLTALSFASSLPTLLLCSAASLATLFRLRFHRIAWPAAFAAALAAVAASRLSEHGWNDYSGLTVAAVRSLLAALGYQAYSHGITVGVPAYAVNIAPGCSGYEGMGLMLAFSSAWLLWFRREYRFPAALLLLPAGIALSWMLNVARLAALIAIGAAGRPDIAMTGFHSQAGWIAFTLLAVAFCWLSPRIPGLARHPSPAIGYPAAPYLVPFLAMQAAALVASASSAGFEWLYPLRVFAAAAALAFVWKHHRFDWSFRWTSLAAGAAVALLWAALSPPVSPSWEALHHAEPIWQWTWIGFRILGGALLAPLVEELAFRGYLMRTLPGWTGLLVSSLAFGAMHGPRWLEASLAGAVYGALYARRGSLADSILAHAITNALLIAAVALTGDARYW